MMSEEDKKKFELASKEAMMFSQPNLDLEVLVWSHGKYQGKADPALTQMCQNELNRRKVRKIWLDRNFNWHLGEDPGYSLTEIEERASKIFAKCTRIA